MSLCGNTAWKVLPKQRGNRAKKVLVKLFQKLARSSRVGLSPSADGETLLTAFLFYQAFLFAPFVSKRKAVNTFYVATRLHFSLLLWEKGDHEVVDEESRHNAISAAQRGYNPLRHRHLIRLAFARHLLPLEKATVPHIFGVNGSKIGFDYVTSTATATCYYTYDALQ